MVKRVTYFFLPLVLAVLILVVFVAVPSRLGFRWSEGMLAIVLSLVFAIAHFFSESALGNEMRIHAVFNSIAGLVLVLLVISLSLFLSLVNSVGLCFAMQSPMNCVQVRKPNELFLFAVLAAPLVEEIILRGYLRRMLLGMRSPEIVVGIITAVVFTLIHAKSGWGASVLIYFSVSLLLSALTYFIDGIALSVFFHSAWNAVAVLVVGASNPYLASPIPWLSSPDLVKLALSIAMVAMCIFIFHQGRRRIDAVRGFNG